jgi:hypothetical protein
VVQGQGKTLLLVGIGADYGLGGRSKGFGKGNEKSNGKSNSNGQNKSNGNRKNKSRSSRFAEG